MDYYQVLFDGPNVAQCKYVKGATKDTHCQMVNNCYCIDVHLTEGNYRFELSSYVAPHELLLNVDALDDGTDIEQFVIQFATMVATLKNGWK